MQEPKDDKDKEYCENVNKFINNPPQPSQNVPVGGLGDLENLGQAQLLQLLGGNPSALSGLSSLLGAGGARPQGRVPVTRTPATSSTQSSQNSKPQTTTSPALPNTNTSVQAQTQSQQPRAPTPVTRSAPAPAGVQLDTLQRIISELTQGQPKGPSLKDIVNVEEILSSGLFDSPEVVARLAEFLPEGQVSAESVRENVRSPQFSQAVAMFNQALRTGQMTGIVSSFGLDPSTVGPNATIEDFLRAVQKKVKEDVLKEKMDTSE